MEYPYLERYSVLCQQNLDKDIPFFIALLRYFVLCPQTLDKDIPFFIAL
jgi:hypothetical protein